MQAPTKARKQKNKLQAKKKIGKSQIKATLLIQIKKSANKSISHITLKYDYKIKYKHKYQMASFELASGNRI